jgi:hypothetical protein
VVRFSGGPGRRLWGGHVGTVLHARFFGRRGRAAEARTGWRGFRANSAAGTGLRRGGGRPPAPRRAEAPGSPWPRASAVPAKGPGDLRPGRRQPATGAVGWEKAARRAAAGGSHAPPAAVPPAAPECAARGSRSGPVEWDAGPRRAAPSPMGARREHDAAWRGVSSARRGRR